MHSWIPNLDHPQLASHVVIRNTHGWAVHFSQVQALVFGGRSSSSPSWPKICCELLSVATISMYHNTGCQFWPLKVANSEAEGRHLRKCACCQAWGPVFHPQDTCGRTEPAPTSSSLPVTCIHTWQMQFKGKKTRIHLTVKAIFPNCYQTHSQRSSLGSFY